MIRLYHGSTVAVRKPSLRSGRPNADFGKGFYTTSNYEQAVRWAHIKKEREDAERAVVSVYEFDETLLNQAGWNIRHFTGADEPWLLQITPSRLRHRPRSRSQRQGVHHSQSVRERRLKCRSRHPAAQGLQDLRPIVLPFRPIHRHPPVHRIYGSLDVKG